MTKWLGSVRDRGWAQHADDRSEYLFIQSWTENARSCRDEVRQDHQVNANEVRRESARGLRPPAGHGFVDAHHVVAHARWRWR
jgi:hypothetical protein